MNISKLKGRNYEWLIARVGYDGDDCLIWPFGKTNGYGVLGAGYAHRIMCALVNGPAPSPNHEAAHSCGRGHEACVHPKHVRWKTKSENQLDRTAHGTRNTWAARGKLTPEEAEQIRLLKGVKPQREIAAMFNTSRSNVSFIHCGKAWNGPRRGYHKTKNGKYRARVRIDNKDYHLGTFDSEEQAHKVYVAASRAIRAAMRAAID